MRIAFVIFDGMTTLDFVGVYEILTRLKTMGMIADLEWEICAHSFQVADRNGLQITPSKVDEPFSDFDLIVIPGGPGVDDIIQDRDFMDWIKTAAAIPIKASVGTGSIVLGAAGYLQGKRATTHPAAHQHLEPYCKVISSDRIVDEGDVITAAGVAASIDLGLYLARKFAGPEAEIKIRHQIDYHLSESSTSDDKILFSTSKENNSANRLSRIASTTRKTSETEIQIEVNLDGSGVHHIDTGIGFLDHMLRHVAVHGLFDLKIVAKGDLHIDPHHTVEDIALTLGQAFRQALGERRGIVRTASYYVPMDEALALVAVDLSGRAYTVFVAEWQSPEIGGIATTLFEHFFSSFANTASLNLHAQVFYGRDDHHQAEALFKALGRALDAATQIDQRRTGLVPSTKGTLVA